MTGVEFIIALAEHRIFGNLFLPYLIKSVGPYYTIVNLVRNRDLNSYNYQFSSSEKQLVKLLDGYSDERLARKFSRGKGFTQFFKELEPAYFQQHIQPYIEKIIFQCHQILMHENIRVFRKASQYSNLHEEDRISVFPAYSEPVFYFDRRPEETRYELKIFQNGKEVKLLDRNFILISQEPGLLYFQNQLFAFENLSAKKIIPFLKKAFVSISKSAEEKYFSSFILHTVRDFKTVPSGFKIIDEKCQPKAWLVIENNLRLEPAFSIQFEYGTEVFQPDSMKRTAVKFENKTGEYVFVKTERDKIWEDEIMDFLLGLGLKEYQGFYLPTGVNYLENETAFYELINWTNFNQEKLAARSVGIKQGKLDKKYFTGSQELKIEVKSSPDWFDVHIILTFGDYLVPFVRLRDLILNGIREFELPNGEIAVLPKEWFARISQLLPHSQIDGNNLRIRNHHYMLLRAEVTNAPRNLFQDFPPEGLTFEAPTSLPADLNAELRNYQKIGFLWMHQLHRHSFGGCLADDMGLGKTLQVLTFLLKFKKVKRIGSLQQENCKTGQLSLFPEPDIQVDPLPASLVIVPTSLVHNWVNEIRKFTPSIKYHQHIGTNRSKEPDFLRIIESNDVILTTYGTLRNDIDWFSRLRFFYLILDESQYIKNPDSKTYKAVMALKAHNRLVLTGTPIENSLSDLWAQMNFLNTGLLGNQPFFRQYYLTPVEKNGNSERQEQLQMVIRPFILRRKKEDVARDLPPLMEQVRYCSMSDEQQHIYEQEKSVIRNSILAAINQKGIVRSSIMILQGLTRLRQLANHPSMLIEDEDAGSGKFNEIFMELRNLMAENHKVLIFSSFVKHLNLLKERIVEEGWKYSVLTGATTGREKVISQFQEDPENRIFLISLKAGGVGLNLTGADYVFIVDPWWNPAAENQAVSRAHRIGQEKHVFVYRFITTNTIEEKIQLLKERKTALADRFINSNDPFQAATREEILELLE